MIAYQINCYPNKRAIVFKFKTFIVSAALISLGGMSFSTTHLMAQTFNYPIVGGGNVPNEDKPIEGNFRVQVASDNGIALRNRTRLEDRSNILVAKGQWLDCNAWAFRSPPVQALGLNRPDYRWYRVSVNGRNYLVPAGWVFGDAPGSVANPFSPDN
jgi:hypothetical protein